MVSNALIKSKMISNNVVFSSIVEYTTNVNLEIASLEDRPFLMAYQEGERYFILFMIVYSRNIELRMGYYYRVWSVSAVTGY